MTTAMGERKRRYTKAEITSIIASEQLVPEQFSWLCALSTSAMVINQPDSTYGIMAGLRSVCVVVIEVDSYPTGIYYETGEDPVIIINTDSSILDYDFISELHVMHDWEVYLWTAFPWTIVDAPVAIYGEWYRSDTYKDGITPFSGKELGWEDLPPASDDEEETHDNSE